jgi:imidazolonepropionase-like amidohydrolase
MKNFSLLALMLGSVAGAQQFPFELEAHRKPSTVTNGDCLIKGGRVMTASKGSFDNTDVLIQKGKIVRIGRNLTAPAGTKVIDVTGKVVVPGIVDGHSHRGSDGTNEGADSITGEVRIGDVLNLSGINVWTALASGHTSAMVLHGSANNVGGQSMVLKYKYGRSATEAPIPDAPRMIKFALGENVTRKSSTNSTRYPNTRMGQEQVYRNGFNEAKKYKSAWAEFNSGKTKVKPRRDIRLETLSDILDRKIWIQCHSYRSDEMLMMVRLSQEFGFKIGAMQHALEAYKIAPELAKAKVGISIFSDEWSFKQEGYDCIPWNAWICQKAGVNVSINTDGLSGTTSLNVDAGKTIRFGGLTEEQALQTITINPAKELGIDHRTGSLEPGKDADIAIWDGTPLSTQAKCVMTMIEGEVFFERRDAFGIDKASTAKQHLDRKMNNWEGTTLPRKSNSYVIQGATIHTISGEDITDGSVVIENGKITGVGKSVKIPAGASIVNARSQHVFPGFFDANSSIGLAEIGPIPVMNDNREFGIFNPELDSLTNIWCESAHFGPAKFNGVTNCFSAPSGGSFSGQGAVINTDGYTTEEFGVERKAALIVNFSAGRSQMEFDLCDQIDSSALFGGAAHQGDAHLTRNQLEQWYEFLGGTVQGTSAGNTQIDRAVEGQFDKAISYMRERRIEPTTPLNLKYEAMLPYILGQKPVVLAASSASAIRSAVAFAQKYRLKAVLTGATEAWKETAILKESGIPVILPVAGKSTLGANSVSNAWDPYDTPYVRAAMLAKAGVKFAFASGEGANVMMLPLRVGMHMAYGLSRQDALKSLTLWPAEMFGVSDRLGSVEKGKIANLIITDGDPLDVTSTMRYVFINGQPRPLTSKHTMLRDKYSQRLGQ